MLFFKPCLVGLLLSVSAFFRPILAVKITVLNACRFAINAAHTADGTNIGYKEGCQPISPGSKATLVDATEFQRSQWVGGRIWATRQTW